MSEAANLDSLGRRIEIPTVNETAGTFVDRLGSYLRNDRTRLYVDTSFLMWLTTIGDIPREEFLVWANELGDKICIPAWSVHEFYRHHTTGTLAKRVAKKLKHARDAARDAADYLQPYAVGTFNLEEEQASYRQQLTRTLKSLDDLIAVSGRWDYSKSSKPIIDWVNMRSTRRGTIFGSLPTAIPTVDGRYSGDVPPGFRDRKKKERSGRGANRFGDFLFWEEVTADAKVQRAANVIIVTNDRKDDWFYKKGDLKVEGEFRRLRANWDSVPSPHPMLAFELSIKTQADTLSLIDAPYLGALLWKLDRPRYAKFANVAIGIAAPEGKDSDRPSRPPVKLSHKRLVRSQMTSAVAQGLLRTAFSLPSSKVSSLLERADADEPDRSNFVSEAPTILSGLDSGDAAAFARALHDRVLNTASQSAEAFISRVFSIFDTSTPDVAAGFYLGIAISAYFKGNEARSVPEGPFLADLFKWQDDNAFEKVISALTLQLKRTGSLAYYPPSFKNVRINIKLTGDAERKATPMEIAQLFVDGIACLEAGLGDVRGDLRAQLGKVASCQVILDQVCTVYGFPNFLVDCDRSGEELMSIPPMTRFVSSLRKSSGPKAQNKEVVSSNPFEPVWNASAIEDNEGDLPLVPDLDDYEFDENGDVSDLPNNDAS